MKHLFYKVSVVVVCMLVYNTIQAQCTGERFKEPVFESYTLKTETFGQNTNLYGVQKILKADIYEPSGDSMQKRPLIILAFGGSFMYGSRENEDIVTLCKAFVKRGYVCASIDYRLGIEGTFANSVTEKTAMEAIIRGFHDGKAAVRYFKKYAGEYRLDTNLFIFGGVSSGAFIALHNAYLDKPEELDEFDIDIKKMGGIEGESGHPGYSSSVKAILNLCGALVRKEWMEPADPMLLSFHGNADIIVPYEEDSIRVNGKAIGIVSGSAALHSFANWTVGIPADLHTFYGAGHVPFYGTSPKAVAYMDTVIRLSSKFLYEEVLNCDEATGLEFTGTHPVFRIFPNPVNDIIHIDWGKEKPGSIEIIDLNGKIILKTEGSSISAENLAPGIYLLKATTGQSVFMEKFVRS